MRGLKGLLSEVASARVGVFSIHPNATGSRISSMHASLPDLSLRNVAVENAKGSCFKGVYGRGGKHSKGFLCVLV